MTQRLLKLKKKCTDHDHDKYIATQEFNNSAASVFTAKLTQRKFNNKERFWW